MNEQEQDYHIKRTRTRSISLQIEKEKIIKINESRELIWVKRARYVRQMTQVNHSETVTAANNFTCGSKYDVHQAKNEK